MSLSLTRRWLAAAALAAAAVGVVAAPANASSHHLRFAPNAHPASAASRHAATIGHYNENGYNWGGMAATGSGFSSVSATWTEPNASCNSSNDLYAPWVGIDGYGSSSVEQTGVATDCSSGSPQDEPWYEMYPAAPVYLNTSQYPVSAGDSITASVQNTSGSSYKLTLSDNTKGWTFTTTQSLSAPRSSAEVIIESPTGAYPNFGSIQFTNCTVNGSPLGSFSPTALDPSANGVTEAHTNPLSGGTNFSMDYLHE